MRAKRTQKNMLNWDTLNFMTYINAFFCIVWSTAQHKKLMILLFVDIRRFGRSHTVTHWTMNRVVLYYLMSWIISIKYALMKGKYVMCCMCVFVCTHSYQYYVDRHSQIDLQTDRWLLVLTVLFYVYLTIIFYTQTHPGPTRLSGATVKKIFDYNQELT